MSSLTSVMFINLPEFAGSLDSYIDQKSDGNMVRQPSCNHGANRL